MRSLFPERSLGVVVVAALSLSACAPSLSLEDRPPPCATGYDLCPTTGVCEKLAASEAACPSSLMVRQGGRVAIPIPGTPAPEVNAGPLRVVPFGAGTEVVEIDAPHGLVPGPYFVKIATTAKGVPARDVTIVVSEIAVGLGGRDDGPGTDEAPFQTLERALEVAGEGDAIVVKEHYSEALAPVGVFEVPARVRLIGRGGGAEISTRLHPAGDVTISNLTLNQPTLILDREKAAVELRDVRMSAVDGVSPTRPRILVTSGARDASVVLTGSHTNIGGIAGPTISVEAEGAALEISDRAIVYGGKGGAPLSLRGNRQVLKIRNASVINWMGPTSMVLEGDGSRVEISGTPALADKDCIINGKADLRGQGIVVSISHTRFLPGVGQGGIFFTGSELRVEGSEFIVRGIEQDSHGSHAVVRNTTFSGYRDAGYRLIQGHLDLGNELEWGGNQFNADRAGLEGNDATAPVALNVTAAPGADAAVTVSGTTFDNEAPVAETVTGVNYCAGWYRISGEGIPIRFF